MTCVHPNPEIAECIQGTVLFICPVCSLVFRNLRESDLRPEEHYLSYYREKDAGRFYWGAELIVRLFRFLRAIGIFFLAKGRTSLLDVGCGRGYTLYYLQRYFRFSRVVGTQISRPAKEFAENVLGLIVHGDLLDHSWGEDRFSMVTMWHVLEHVPAPEAYVQKIYELLTPQGLLVIEVPNYHSWTRRLSGGSWMGYDFENHISFFSPASLQRILAHSGFRVVKQRSFSAEYSTFFSAESIASRVTGDEWAFFRILQGGPITFRGIVHGFVFFAILPMSLVINLVLAFSDRGEVLHVVAQKLPK